MFDLSGKNALITGATGGIGSAIARGLHGAGATVAITGTRVERLDALKRELNGRAHSIPCQLSDPNDVAELVQRAGEEMGSVDILVNNAGITRDNLFVRMADDQWNAVLEINLSATMILCRSVVRKMMRAKWGRIVNITSVVGTTGNAGQVNYSASKAAITGLSKSLAAEVATRGITVNCVAPGMVETDMLNELPEIVKGKKLELVPMGRVGSPDDVGAAVVYLASNEAGYVTGHTLHVNGGMAMI